MSRTTRRHIEHTRRTGRSYAVVRRSARGTWVVLRCGVCGHSFALQLARTHPFLRPFCPHCGSQSSQPV